MKKVELFVKKGIVRWDPVRKLWWLMHNPDPSEGWASYGRCYQSLRQILDNYAIAIVAGVLYCDECGVYLEFEKLGAS